MGDRRREPVVDDVAPHSRLFIIGSKTLAEDELRDAFKEYGYIKDIKAIKDRNTGENKGIFYIKYSKTSDAAKALENMKGRIIGGRSIKVMIASSREQGSVRDDNEEDHVKRLFVVVSKATSDNEVYDYFKQFGNLEYASILKDKQTKESKGFAYVKYLKFSDAANAFEQCDRKYKPVFAEPRRSTKEEPKNSYYQNDPPALPYKQDRQNRHDRHDNGTIPAPNEFKEDGVYKLSVVASPVCNQDQMWKLFDIVPSLDYCQVSFDMAQHVPRTRGPLACFEVVYTNAEWAMYAVEKFHGFEYPPGHRLVVKMESPMRASRGPPNARSLPNPHNAPIKRSASSLGESSSHRTELMRLAETLAQANSLIKAAGLSPDLIQSKLLMDTNKSMDFCNVDLPDPKPILNIDTPTAARCFIVCFPNVLSPSVLKDLFCRFGDLIDVYMLNNKNCGYVRYATKEAAEDAIRTLHGAEVLGTRLKVLEAEERPDKRQKLDSQSSEN